MSYIKNILDELVNFNTKVKDYSTNSKSGSKKDKEVLLAIVQAEFDKFQRLSHENLNYSLLTGEYISNEEFLDLVGKLKSQLSKLLDSVALIQELQNITYQMVEGLIQTLQIYAHFQSDIVNKYSITRKDYFFNLTSSYLGNKLEREAKEYIGLFNLNVAIARFDLFLSQEQDRLYHLFAIENSLKKINLNGSDSLRELIIKKCNFLKAKWFLRKQEEAPDEAEVPFMIDGQEHHLQQNEDETYNNWSTYSSVHYELEKNWKSRIEDDSKRLYNKELSTLSSLEIHRLIKYNKDVEEDLEELGKISDYLCKKSLNLDQGKSNFFDEYAYSVMSNYALNNKFSLFVERNKDITAIIEEYKKIKKKSNKYLNNFFLEYKFLDTAITILKDHLNKKENNEFLKEHKDFVENELKNIYEKYEFNHNWSLKRYNYIFQLPFEECKIQISGNRMTKFLFIASSFVLPPSLKKLENQFDSIRTRYNELLHHIDSIKILKIDLDKIDKLNEEIKSQKEAIDRNQIKFIEILGIFTALIAYIFGSISTFRFLETPQEFLLFNVALGLSLITFVSILIIFIRGRDALRRNWGWLIGLFILFLLFWASIIYFDFIPANQDDDKNVLLKKVDSISVEVKLPISLSTKRASMSTTENKDSIKTPISRILPPINPDQDSTKSK